MAQNRSFPARVDPLDFERECETWDWARTAGVSAQDLQKTLRDWLRAAEDPGYAKAA